MRGVPVIVTVVAAVVVATAAYGLVVTEQRAGPYDAEMRPVVVEATVSGTYQARGDSSVAGACLLPPCHATTIIDARFSGLPISSYSARLDGPSSVALGDLVKEGDRFVLRWSDDVDHTDKTRIVLTLAGRDIASVPVSASDEPAPLGGSLDATWPVMSARAYLTEIGGVTVSTVAYVELRDAAPVGWRFHAWFDGPSGRIDLGPLEATEDGATLDARVERVGIEHQDRLVIALVQADVVTAVPDGFPVLQLDLGAFS